MVGELPFTDKSHGDSQASSSKKGGMMLGTKFLLFERNKHQRFVRTCISLGMNPIVNPPGNTPSALVQK
jgi:hypothetical protein